MKKIYYSCIVILLICMMIFFRNCRAFALESDIEYDHYMTEEAFLRDFNFFVPDEGYGNETPMKTYFRKLLSYSPKNSHGSCGYVSFIQYLSYYDTFLNDNIIPEQYDMGNSSSSNMSTARLTSPGVLRQDYPETNLYEFIQDNKHNDFQMYLMDIVNSSKNLSSSSYKYNIGMWDYHYIIEELFPANNLEFEYTYYTDLSEFAKPTDNSIKEYFDDYIKSQLDLGNPVVVQICHYNDDNIFDIKYENNHSVVAYYYDTNGIHANFGWNSAGSTDVVINDYYQIMAAGVINFSDLEVVHSNNYIVNNISYCGCGVHVHNYVGWEYYSKTSHKAVCECGESGVTSYPHAIKSSDVGKRTAKCIQCNCILDLTKDMSFVVYNRSKKVLYSINGSYILENGIIVLVEDDIDLYLNGALYFYEDSPYVCVSS